MSGCVSTTTSTLTKKADPKIAVERYVNLGLEYIKRNEFQRARKHLERALEIDPEDASANAALGLIYHEQDEAETAEKLFLKALAVKPDYTNGRSYYGAFLFSESRYQEALKQFDLASNDKEYPGRSQIFSNIALCYLKLDQKDLAIEAYTKTLRLDRVNGRALSGITELLIDAGKFKRAQHYYNRLVRLFKDKGMQYSAQSLWMGIRITHYFGSVQQEKNMVILLRENYPSSEEYLQYQRMTSSEVFK